MTGPLTPPPRMRRGAPPAGETATDESAEPVAPTDSFFDWGDHGEAAEAGLPPIEEPGAYFDDESGTTPPAERSRKSRAAAARRPERRFRQTIVKFDLWSVTKMALCFYTSAMGVVVVALIALWVVADSAGVIRSVEKFVGDLFSSKDFTFVSGQVLRGAVLICVVLVALMTVVTIVGASFYNIFAELFGGVEIVIREEDQPVR